MPVIQKLSQHVADLIAAGEVVERPASVVKELIENAVDAGAQSVTVEIQNGGVTFIRVTDDGCGMSAEDAETAFLRHATSKLRTEEDLGAIGTMGFRGEALAAISSVSRIDLLTRTADAPAGTSLHLEAGVVTEKLESGCPVGTTILVRDLFYNTPARMKFLKRDSVEGAAVAAAAQKQALAHPEVAIRLLRDGDELFCTAGDGDLHAALYAVFGRQLALDMVPVQSGWNKVRIRGFVTKPSATRGNRSYQQFYVNSRPVVSKLLIKALEQAYDNQLMVGRFPACVLHIDLPADAVDVNVHPAKTEVKFLAEQEVYDCVRYGVMAALQEAPARPEVTFSKAPTAPAPAQPQRKNDFYQSMTSADYRAYAEALKTPNNQAQKLASPVYYPTPDGAARAERFAEALQKPAPKPEPAPTPKSNPAPAPEPEPVQEALPLPEPEPVQETISLPETQSWRLVGEVLDTYLVVQEGETVLFMDKHAAHERILFEKYRAQQEPIMSQVLLSPACVELDREDAALLLQSQSLLEELGYEIEDFGDGSVLVRRVPDDIDAEDAAASLEAICADLREGRQDDPAAVRDKLLHTVACKAAIKAGWQTRPEELEALCREVMRRDDIRYCPHGRPVCISLTKAQLERQFKRS